MSGEESAQGNRKCKGPEEAACEVGADLEYLNSKEASMVKTKQRLIEGLGATMNFGLYSE